MHLVDTLFSYNKTKMISRSNIISELHKRILYLNKPTQTSVAACVCVIQLGCELPDEKLYSRIRLPYKRDTIQKIVDEKYIYNLSTYRIVF